MPVKDLHDKPFDEGTITKLEIFENYAKEWLPTFIMSYPNQELWIFDYFAGTGYDKKGVEGSPIRLLRQIKNQIGNIFQQNIKVCICFNEYKKNKYALLEESCKQFIDNDADLTRLHETKHLSVHYRQNDFAVLFPKTLSTISKHPSLLYLDQNGMKFLADKYLLDLEKLSTTDFLYYLSSSYFVRFGNTHQFQTNLKIDIERAMQNPYKYIHRSILEQLKERIPENSELRLYPFSIKKGTNVYGIIFGAKNPRAVEKFLTVAWKKNNINGEANFDIDNEVGKAQLNLFEKKKLTKIEQFQSNLKKWILSGTIRTNKDAFDYVLEQGHISEHATSVVREMKKMGLIDYDAKSPLINYEQVYRHNRIVEYTLLKK